MTSPTLGLHKAWLAREVASASALCLAGGQLVDNIMTTCMVDLSTHSQMIENCSVHCV